jgi:tRNA A-37 threonylcarbamoyl transferase component Bud32
MAPRRPRRSAPRIEAFNFEPGQVLAGKYRIEAKLGGGWEGEVYRVVERRTGVQRAAKVFFPHRNERDRAVRFYARKLDRLRKCAIVIQYVHSEQIRYHDIPITCLISEYVEGELLDRFTARQPGKRLPVFEGMHLLYSLALGLEQIHRAREYHGDIHDSNVMVRRRGIFFDVKLVDFFHWGAATASHIKQDVGDLVRLFYDALGGRKHYAKQPPEVKTICKGMRTDLIGRAYPTASHLREYLETFEWTQ